MFSGDTLFGDSLFGPRTERKSFTERALRRERKRTRRAAGGGRRQVFRLGFEQLEARHMLSAGSIAGSVFHDVNGDGTQQAGELGIEGATVFLDTNRNGALDGGETATTTAADGSYEFTGLATGDYTVAQILPTGWLQTAAGSPGVGRMGEVIHSIPPAATAGGYDYGPYGVAWVNGELYQIEGRDPEINKIWRLDPQAGAVLGSFTPAFELNYLAFDGTNLWGTRSDTIYHFTTDGTLLHTFDSPGTSPTGIAWDGSHLWVADNTSTPTTIYKLDASDLSGAALPVVQSFAGPDNVSYGMTFDGQHLWISGQSSGSALDQGRYFHQVDRATGQVLQTITPPGYTHYSTDGRLQYSRLPGLAFDGHALWYSDRGLQELVDGVSRFVGTRIVQLDPGGDHRDVTVVDGQASTAAAIGNAQLATISGKVFNDANQDGDQDAGEAGLAGRKVFLDHDGNGLLHTTETVALTDAAGNYQLAGRVGQSYTVAQVLPPDWQQVSPAGTGQAVSVTQSGEVLAGLDFADFAPVQTKFFVVNDGSPDGTYEYQANGTAVENYALAAGNTAPRGAASNVDVSTTWVVDAGNRVYVYSHTGALVGNWEVTYFGKPVPKLEGITVFGDDVWLVDASRDRITHYVGGAHVRGGSRLPDATSGAFDQFDLASGNKNPKDLVTDGTHIWVVDDANTNKVFKYTMTGALVGSWTIASPNSTPTGITLDPTGASNDLWIVDSGTDKVYQYTGGKSWTSGTRSASATFNLAAGNTNPQGIADPPTGDVSVSISDASYFEGDSPVIVGPPITAGLSGAASAMTVGPDGDLFVANFSGDRLVRYDGATGDLHGVLTAADLDGPRGLRFGPDGHLYVAATTPGQVLRFDGTTGAALGTFVAPSAAGTPYDVAFDLAGNLLVAYRDTDQILRYQGPSGATPGALIDVFAAFAAGSRPSSLVFGPDGNLYVGCESFIQRHDPITGAPIDVFVTQGGRPAFDAAGNLYVSAGFDTVLVFQGPGGATPGALIGPFWPRANHTGPLGMRGPGALAFDPDGNLLAAFDGGILRFRAEQAAVFTVTLSSASELPVTVSYATLAGTAQAGSDFTTTVGELHFAPGQTTRTFLVPVVDDSAAELIETFSASISTSSSGATIADGLGVATIHDDDNKFFVVNDGSPDRTYEYDSSGAAFENYPLAAGNTAPRGVATNADGSRVWVVDANRTVYRYDRSGALLTSWPVTYWAGSGQKSTTPQLEGVTVYGTHLWLVDAKGDQVLYYPNMAFENGANPALGVFNLASGNKNPKDLVTDGTHIWVVDDAGSNKVFKYTMTGTLVGSWTIASPNSTPTGITLDPTGASNDLWIVDSGTDKVYQYTGGKSWTSGTRTASATFNLAAGNTNPQGIADPPTGDLISADSMSATPSSGGATNMIEKRFAARDAARDNHTVAWAWLDQVRTQHELTSSLATHQSDRGPSDHRTDLAAAVLRELGYQAGDDADEQGLSSKKSANQRLASRRPALAETLDDLQGDRLAEAWWEALLAEARNLEPVQ
jgi:hypothetical protein